MPLNSTEAERRQQAAEDLADKLRLERGVTIELRRLFRQMARDTAMFVSATGQAPSANVYEDDIRGILSRQNRKVTEEFSGQVLDFIREEEDDPVTEGLALVAIALGLTLDQLLARLDAEVTTQKQEFIRRNTSSDTAQITRTNQTEIDAAVAGATAAIIADGRQPTNDEVGRRAGRDLRRRGPGRADTIAATVTQKASEGIKEIERNEFLRVRNSITAVSIGLPPIEDKEVWVTVGDEKVRASHVEADGQEKEGGFFTVQGEQLRFPGDPNGSPSNIINCRCSALSVLEFESGLLPTAS